MPDIRTALSEALQASESGTLQAPTETPIETEVPHETPEEPKADRARDDLGRFAPQKQEAKPEPVKEQVQQPEPKPARKPPSSWKKDYWQHWERLGTDPELARLQDYIEEREAQAASGVHQYKSQLDQHRPVLDAVGKFLPELQQHNIQPAQWIENLGTAHRVLALGTPEQKLQMLTWLASQYGVDPSSIQTGQPNQQFGQVWQQAQTAQQRAEQALKAVEEFQKNQLQTQIEAFAKEHPHFSTVRETMGQLLASGVAADMETAYQKALRLHDDIWQQQQAEQRAAEEAKRAAELARKKAAAASPKSVSPTGEAATGGGKGKSIRDVLSSAYDEAAGGRL